MCVPSCSVGVGRLAVPDGTRARGAKMIARPCLNSTSQERELYGSS
ncbi:hypothetical protein [Nonomuraea sp. NPDC049480]